MSLPDYVVIICLFLFNALIAVGFSRNIKTFEVFAIGHRTFGTFVIFATLSASFLGGGYTLGNAERVFNGGMLFALALLGFSLKEILMGQFIAPRMGRFHDCVSVGDIMEKAYGKPGKVFAGVFGMLVCTGILGAQANAMGQIINTFFEGPPYVGTFIGFGFIVLYCTTGGMKAVVYTDVIQFLLLAIALPVLFYIGLQHVGGWHEVVEQTPVTFTAPSETPSFWFILTPLFLTFMLGETTVPPYAQRLLMAKNPEITRRATLLSGFLSAPFFLLAGALGLIALVINPDINGNQAIPFLAETLLSPGWKGLVIAGLIAIVMSSASSFLNAAAICAVNDVIMPLRKAAINPSSLLWVVRIITLVVGAFSLLFALSFQNAMDALVYAYNFWSPLILIPLLAVILDVSTSQRQLWGSIVVSLLAMFICQQVPWWGGKLSTTVVGVVASLLSFLALKRWKCSKDLSITETGI
ncbi:sodium:solute symporter family protein [Candidatus Sororendozoicomonas aggregata]|uniref:sodium:solute symporter family protein n=1 Tax=Candidatus Sororendozoicomonas aggregata TaxID=3073239 RepID=UPI002ED075AD